MIEKSNSQIGNLVTYRPITVSTVLYRTFTKVLAYKIQEWTENNYIMGEMQSGFRRGRRGDDCLFVLISIIEMSRKQNRGLVCAFLDATRAYDGVDRALLWETLHSQGMCPDWIKVLQMLYVDNRVQLCYEEHRSDWVTPKTGLRQGC